MNYKIRKKLMKDIEAKENKDVIFFYNGCGYGKKDCINEDMERVYERILLTKKRKHLLFIVETHGGVRDANSGIMRRICNAYETVTIAIYDKAKSSGTVMCLYADKILMTKNSQLGPIDGQNRAIDLRLKDETFPTEEIANILEQEGLLTRENYNRESLELAFLKMSLKNGRDSRMPTIEKHVGEDKKEAVYKALTSKGDHGTPIFYEEAKELGLKVELMDASLENLIRQLYFSAQDELKEFEQLGPEYVLGDYLASNNEKSKNQQFSYKYSVIESPRKSYAHIGVWLVDAERLFGDRIRTLLIGAGWREED